MKKELIIMIGLPGSGKSVFVDKKYSETYQVVCTDDVRKALGFIFERKMEPLVHCISETIVKAKMERGLPIIIDETNIRSSHLLKWKNLAEEYEYKTTAIIMDTNIDECKKRRKCNEGKFPEEVIDRMNISLEHLKLDSLDFYFDKVLVYKDTTLKLKNEEQVNG